MTLWRITELNAGWLHPPVSFVNRSNLEDLLARFASTVPWLIYLRMSDAFLIQSRGTPRPIDIMSDAAAMRASPSLLTIAVFTAVGDVGAVGPHCISCIQQEMVVCRSIEMKRSVTCRS